MPTPAIAHCPSSDIHEPHLWYRPDDHPLEGDAARWCNGEPVEWAPPASTLQRLPDGHQTINEYWVARQVAAAESNQLEGAPSMNHYAEIERLVGEGAQHLVRWRVTANLHDHAAFVRVRDVARSHLALAFEEEATRIAGEL